ncbi:MAG: hypothetical protein MR624_08880 [Bacteroidales bacterium]|nr:hypothetical protein [Bacteroidales bacterium]MCI6253106.1 hypothetical protein [Bacteroidales bacterium]MDY4029624.1 hypothetical protein [Alloprevotella sp.]MDY6033914.1 hypothetical protein [Alloprevotella sp.]
MKSLRFTLLAWLVTVMLWPAAAQQQVETRRTKSVFANPEFVEAKVLQPFGRSVKAKANILLKNSTLCFMRGDTILEAYVANVLGVEFDSIHYMKVNDKQMARVVAEKDYCYLLCVTTINMSQVARECAGSENVLSDIGDGQLAARFAEAMSTDYSMKNGFPLQDKYYFNIRGQIIPANQTAFKPFVKPEMKNAFKRLMNDKWWSWKDPASLAQLFTYIKEP